MEMLLDLAVPILVSAAVVWIYSALAWMVIGHHGGDMAGAPDEEALIAAVRGLGLKPDTYAFPHCKSKGQQKDPAFIEKWKTGPAGMLSVWGPMSMGRNMALSFLVYLAVSLLVGYIGSVAIAPGASFSHVFRVLATAGILGYVFGSLPHAIWFQARRHAVVTCAIDGVIQGLLTGAVFAWMWPASAAVSVPGAL